MLAFFYIIFLQVDFLLRWKILGKLIAVIVVEYFQSCVKPILTSHPDIAYLMYVFLNSFIS